MNCPVGNVVNRTDYYPFGLEMDGLTQRSNDPDDRYLYSGKELDREHSLRWYYFGARYYHPALGRWLAVDPLWEKYLNFTPYHYVLNNPIEYVDVHGDSVWINFIDSDGSEKQILYNQGMEYKGNNEQVAAMINILNILNSVSSGNKILSCLTGSTAKYNVKFDGLNPSSYITNGIKKGSGGIISLGNLSDVSKAAHEFFHAYQHENMDMINSTAFEVEAYLFEASIYSQLNQGMIVYDFSGGNQLFTKAFENLLYNFGQDDFNTATKTFKQSSYNMLGGYNKLEPITINNPLIKRFYPLLEK